jgi:hypothetical protein
VATSPNKPDQPSSEAIINLGAAPILGLGAPWLLALAVAAFGLAVTVIVGLGGRRAH